VYILIIISGFSEEKKEEYGLKIMVLEAKEHFKLLMSDSSISILLALKIHNHLRKEYYGAYTKK